MLRCFVPAVLVASFQLYSLLRCRAILVALLLRSIAVVVASSKKMVNQFGIGGIPHEHPPPNDAMDSDDPMTTDQESSNYPESTVPSSEECCPSVSVVDILSGNQGIADAVVRRDSEVQTPTNPVTVDDGIDSPMNLDHILRADEYYGELDELARETVQACRIDLIQTELLGISKTHSLLILHGCHESLNRLQAAGFSNAVFSIFVEDVWRNVANTVYVTTAQLELLIACIENRVSYSDQTGEQLVRELAARLQLEGANLLGQVSKALGLGLISFSVSHANRFDLEILNEEREVFDIGPGLHFSLRKLACLDEFIGGPVWVLSRNGSTSELKLSIDVEHFDVLWGPVWFLEDGSIMVQKGYIGGAEPTSNCASDEIESHWTNSPSGTNNRLTPNSKLLIGSTDAPLTHNQACTPMIQQPQRLQVPGVQQQRYVAEGMAVNVSGGKHVNVGVTKNWKIAPARTQKDMVLKACRFETTQIVPVLGMRSGLETSTCTGHAQRITLWEALCFSFSRTGIGNCHAVGDVDCLSFCWNGQAVPPNTVDQPVAKLSREEARRKLVEGIEKLAQTGVGSDGDLRVWWPFTQVELTCALEARTNRWVSLLKDTMNVSTFAVATSRCLRVGVVGLSAKTCQESGEVVFGTSITVPEALVQGRNFRLGEGRLSVQSVSQSGQVPVVVAKIQVYPGMFEKIRIMAWKRALLASENVIPEVAAEITMTLIAY